MIKALIFFAILLGLAFAGAWVADRPGSIAIDWLGHRVEISVLVGMVAIFAAIGGSIALWITARSIWLSPKMVSGFFSSRRRDKGYQALSTGMIAVGVGDLALAQKQANKARKLVGEDPMTLMLEAQTAQLAGNATKARQSFEAMLDNDQTMALGRRGLFIEAQRRGDADEAMEMAKAAVEGSKKPANWAGTALLDMQTASHDWAGALMTLSQNHANKYITKDEFRRSRAVILTAQAIEMEGQEERLADMRGLLLDAVKLAPGLTAAAVKAAKVLAELGEQRKAFKIVEAAWKVEPHPDLVTVYTSIKSGETVRDRLKRVRSLTGLKPDHLESKLALARVLIDAREWADARSALDPLVAERVTPRLCSLMAELEEGDGGDFGRVREWLARAVSAKRDPVWVADGQVSEVWQPTSPVTGKLDVFEWKVPVQDMVAGPVLEAAELDEEVASEADTAEDGQDKEIVLIPPAKDAGAVKEPVEAEDIATDAKDVTPAEDEAEKSDVAPADEPIVVAGDDTKAAADDEEGEKGDASSDKEDKSEAKASEASKEDDDSVKEVEFPLPHAPDDPGPKGDEVPASPEKRFRLF